MALRTDYKDDILDTSVNKKRVYNLIDQSGNVVMSGLSLEDVTVYSQNGDELSSSAINEAFDNINNRKLKTYTSLSQLGLSEDDVTSHDIIALALGKNAVISFQVTSAQSITLYNNGIIPFRDGGKLEVANINGRSEYIFTRSKGIEYHKVLTNYIDSTPLIWMPWKKVDMYIELTGTLTAGKTSITLTDDSITTDSTFDFYTSIYGVSPTNVVVAAGSITLEFDAQSVDMAVEVRVM